MCVRRSQECGLQGQRDLGSNPCSVIYQRCVPAELFSPAVPQFSLCKLGVGMVPPGKSGVSLGTVDIWGWNTLGWGRGLSCTLKDVYQHTWLFFPTG